MKKISHLVCQFDRLSFNKEGGGKLTLEFGMDSAKEIQKIQDWVSQNEQNLAVAVSPLDLAHDDTPNLEDY